MRKAAVLLAVAVASVTVTACGSSNDEAQSSSTTSAGASTSAQVIDIGLKDFMIDPSPLSAKVGPVTFKVVNDGNATHNFYVSQAGTVVAKTKNLSPKDTEDLTTDLKAGTYDVYCQIPGHASLGMKTTLTVS